MKTSSLLRLRVAVFSASLAGALTLGGFGARMVVTNRASAAEDHGPLNSKPVSEKEAQQAFLDAYKVFMHPRCMNCHPVGDAPLQGDDSHIHVQNVKRGPEGKGKYALKC